MQVGCVENGARTWSRSCCTLQNFLIPLPACHMHMVAGRLVAASVLSLSRPISVAGREASRSERAGCGLQLQPLSSHIEINDKLVLGAEQGPDTGLYHCKQLAPCSCSRCSITPLQEVPRP